MKNQMGMSGMTLMLVITAAGCGVAPAEEAPEQRSAPVSPGEPEASQQAITFPPGPAPTTVCTWTNTHQPVPKFPGLCWWDVLCITVKNGVISSTKTQNLWLCSATTGPNG